MHSLHEHYKSVRARMGIVQRPNTVAIERPAPPVLVDMGDHAPADFELPVRPDRGFLAERQELQRLIDLRVNCHPAPPSSMKACYLATAQHFEITTAEILGPSRARRFTIPRHIGFYLAKELTGNPWGMLAQYARRDHTSILHGWRKIDRLLRAGSKDICLVVEAIKTRLEP